MNLYLSNHSRKQNHKSFGTHMPLFLQKDLDIFILNFPAIKCNVLRISYFSILQKSDRSPARSPNGFKVFVQRDYTEGTAVKFQVKYPLELEGKVRHLIIVASVEKVYVKVFFFCEIRMN